MGDQLALCECGLHRNSSQLIKEKDLDRGRCKGRKAMPEIEIFTRPKQTVYHEVKGQVRPSFNIFSHKLTVISIHAEIAGLITSAEEVMFSFWLIYLSVCQQN